VVEDVEAIVDEVKQEVTKEVHKLDQDMKESLESVDPWLANKLQQKSTATAPEEPAEEPAADC
jgi:hypothetical protein